LRKDCFNLIENDIKLQITLYKMMGFSLSSNSTPQIANVCNFITDLYKDHMCNELSPGIPTCSE
ncbi:MAG: hypothetical protein MHPSP_003525, partial [Paramarteilia canceri]